MAVILNHGNANYSVSIVQGLLKTLYKYTSMLVEQIDMRFWGQAVKPHVVLPRVSIYCVRKYSSKVPAIFDKP